MLDIPETEAEKHAAAIRLDNDKKKYFEDMPFGIRGVAGTNKLLIACEAEDVLARRGDKGHTEETLGPLRRHYEVSAGGGGIKAISASSFLEQVGANSGRTANSDNLRYNELVAIAWKRFSRDIKNESAKNPKRKHQEYFERKLVDIATHDTRLADRAKRLQPFVAARMRPTHQPYRSLIDLHRRIDRGKIDGFEETVLGLEKIRARHGDAAYVRIIRKPRILYSLMVRA